MAKRMTTAERQQVDAPSYTAKRIIPHIVNLDEQISVIAQAGELVTEALRRIDNGDTLRQWELMESLGAAESIGSALDDIDGKECEETHCNLLDGLERRLGDVAGETIDQPCSVIIESLLDRIESMEQERDQHVEHTPLPESAPAAIPCNHATLTADNTALREMVTLLRQQNDILRAKTTKAFQRKIA